MLLGPDAVKRRTAAGQTGLPDAPLSRDVRVTGDDPDWVGSAVGVTQPAIDLQVADVAETTPTAGQPAAVNARQRRCSSRRRRPW